MITFLEYKWGKHQLVCNYPYVFDILVVGKFYLSVKQDSSNSKHLKLYNSLTTPYAYSHVFFQKTVRRLEMVKSRKIEHD